MSQAIYSSIGGIISAQTQIDVVADNIANMNTVAFKQSKVNFENIYSRTINSGSAPSSTTGGSNPIQIGLGVTLGSISRNFTSGTVQSTGKPSDLNIQGAGYFTLVGDDGSVSLTRAGNFQLDAQGNMTTSDGVKILGTDALNSSTGSQTTVKIPPSLKMVTEGNSSAGTKLNNELNNCSLSYGTFDLTFKDGTGAEQTVTIELDSTTDTTPDAIVSTINSAVGEIFDSEAFSASVTDGRIVFSINPEAGSDITQIRSIASTSSGSSNFLSETNLNSASPDEVVVEGEEGEEGTTYITYTSKVLDYVASISPEDSNDSSDASSYSIGQDGAIQVTYSNGDKLSVETNGNSRQLLYTTAEGVRIRNSDITVSGHVLEAANLQLQLANVVNEGGLVSKGGNTFALGPNTGNVIYSIPNSNSLGSIASGGLESSNVDLSSQFAEMILAQRQIDANSRTFQTSNEIMRKIVMLGQ